MGRSASGRPTGPVGAGGVDRPEPGRGEGGEHQRVRSDGFRDALAATGGTGVEQLPHVAGVLIRAGRAHRCPPVAAPHQQHPIRLAVGRVASARWPAVIRPRSRTGWEQCPHRATCSAHRSKSVRPARSRSPPPVRGESRKGGQGRTAGSAAANRGVTDPSPGAAGAGRGSGTPWLPASGRQAGSGDQLRRTRSAGGATSGAGRLVDGGGPGSSMRASRAALPLLAASHRLRPDAVTARAGRSASVTSWSSLRYADPIRTG